MDNYTNNPVLSHVYDTVPFFSRDNVKIIYPFVELRGAFYHPKAMCDFCKNKEARAYPIFEPDNPHDINAIALRLDDGRTIGYVPREIAAEIATIDTSNLFIRPRIKEFLSSDDYWGDKAYFKFDIVRVKNPDLLTSAELKTLTPIVHPHIATEPNNNIPVDDYKITLTLMVLASAVIIALSIFVYLH